MDAELLNDFDTVIDFYINDRRGFSDLIGTPLYAAIIMMEECVLEFCGSHVTYDPDFERCHICGNYVFAPDDLKHLKCKNIDVKTFKYMSKYGDLYDRLFNYIHRSRLNICQDCCDQYGYNDSDDSDDSDEQHTSKTVSLDNNQKMDYDLIDAMDEIFAFYDDEPKYVDIVGTELYKKICDLEDIILGCRNCKESTFDDEYCKCDLCGKYTYGDINVDPIKYDKNTLKYIFKDNRLYDALITIQEENDGLRICDWCQRQYEKDYSHCFDFDIDLWEEQVNNYESFDISDNEYVLLKYYHALKTINEHRQTQLYNALRHKTHSLDYDPTKYPEREKLNIMLRKNFYNFCAIGPQEKLYIIANYRLSCCTPEQIHKIEKRVADHWKKFPSYDFSHYKLYHAEENVDVKKPIIDYINNLTLGDKKYIKHHGILYGPKKQFLDDSKFEDEKKRLIEYINSIKLD